MRQHGGIIGLQSIRKSCVIFNDAIWLMIIQNVRVSSLRVRDCRIVRRHNYVDALELEMIGMLLQKNYCLYRPTSVHALQMQRQYKLLKVWTLLYFFAHRLANLHITMKPKEEGKNRSFVWDYFGYTNDQSGKRVADEQVFCMPCFEKGQLKGYKETVSTTNLAGHLRESHSIL